MSDKVTRYWNHRKSLQSKTCTDTTQGTTPCMLPRSSTVIISTTNSRTCATQLFILAHTVGGWGYTTSLAQLAIPAGHVHVHIYPYLILSHHRGAYIQLYAYKMLQYVGMRYLDPDRPSLLYLNPSTATRQGSHMCIHMQCFNYSHPSNTSHEDPVSYRICT